MGRFVKADEGMFMVKEVEVGVLALVVVSTWIIWSVVQVLEAKIPVGSLSHCFTWEVESSIWK